MCEPSLQLATFEQPARYVRKAVYFELPQSINDGSGLFICKYPGGQQVPSQALHDIVLSCSCKEGKYRRSTTQNQATESSDHLLLGMSSSEAQMRQIAPMHQLHQICARLRLPCARFRSGRSAQACGDQGKNGVFGKDAGGRYCPTWPS